MTTGHGAHISAAKALTLYGDARIIPVLLNHNGEILAHGTSRRIFTEGQRLAMIARDQGCSFPGCTLPPALSAPRWIDPTQTPRRNRAHTPLTI